MTAREEQLTSAFIRLADTMVEDYDLVELLQQLVDGCIVVVDSGSAGVLLDDQRGTLQVLASTSEQIRLLELFQIQADSGPCVDAFRTGTSVLVPDLAAQASRWPEFSRAAAELGIVSAHALPLRLRAHIIGAIGLFGTEVGQLDATDLRAAQALADMASIGILHQRALQQSEILNEQLQHALNSRVIIEQAKGVLAGHALLTMDTAFGLLRSFARANNQRLVAVARGVVDGTIPAKAVLAQK
jgi:GAF domain-containing protein